MTSLAHLTKLHLNLWLLLKTPLIKSIHSSWRSISHIESSKSSKSVLMEAPKTLNMIRANPEFSSTAISSKFSITFNSLWASLSSKITKSTLSLIRMLQNSKIHNSLLFNQPSTAAWPLNQTFSQAPLEKHSNTETSHWPTLECNSRRVKISPRQTRLRLDVKAQSVSSSTRTSNRILPRDLSWLQGTT